MQYIIFRSIVEIKIWKISARRCGAKHISKLKILKIEVSDHFGTFIYRKNMGHSGTKSTIPNFI